MGHYFLRGEKRAAVWLIVADFAKWLSNGLPSWATYQAKMSGRLIALDKHPRVNPIRIESCESFWSRAKAFMSECVAITDDSSGSGIIKCE